MPEQQEWIYYEVMWRNQAQQGPMPQPWWIQQYFRRWVDDYDGGLFPSKEASFCSNALYRYWNMVGVKNTPQECLIGQSGEIEPVYDEYALGFFLFDPAGRRISMPQRPGFSGASAALTQAWQDSYLPAEPLGQRDVGFERRRLFGGDRGEVDRVGDRAAHQIVRHLLGDLQRDVLLRLVGRGAEVRRRDEVGRAEQRIRWSPAPRRTRRTRRRRRGRSPAPRAAPPRRPGRRARN